MAKRKKLFTILAGLVGLVIVVGVVAQYNKESRAAVQKTPAAIPVSAAQVVVKSMPVRLMAIGNVEPFTTVAIKTRVDGQLISVKFKEGDEVRQGSVMFEIDPRPFQAQLTQAEGQLARDQANLANARLDLERYRRLAEQEMIARQQLDTQQMVVNQAEASMKMNAGSIDAIKLQLTYCRITSPITGRVGLRLVDAGNVVKAADPGGLVVIAQLEPIALVFSVPEDSLQPVLRRFRTGGKVPVDAYDREGRTKIATGTLVAIDNQIDPTTGTVRLKASFGNTDGVLYPNQFVNARVLIDVLHDAVLAPAEAIQRGPQGTYVYVVKPDKVVQMRRVQLGPSEGGVIAVRAGVADNEALVVDGAEKVQDGARVEPTVRKVGPATPRPGA